MTLADLVSSDEHNPFILMIVKSKIEFSTQTSPQNTTKFQKGKQISKPTKFTLFNSFV